MNEDLEIGQNLATLNLFREADGRIFLTVADSSGAMIEWTRYGLFKRMSLYEYVFELIKNAENL